LINNYKKKRKKMLVYSYRFSHLTKNIYHLVEEILVKEVGVNVIRGRFWNHEKTFSYPISIVIYSHKKCLGYFDPEFLELGFHQAWAFKSLEELKDVIRHELAHYLIFIKYGPYIDPHGKEFKDLCLSYGWGENVYRASKEFEYSEGVQEEEKVRKIKKLLALSSSHNPYEAEQALLKARELMIKSDFTCANSEEEIFYLKRVLKQNAVDGKMRAIAKICETFFVSCVFHKTPYCVYLEILGSYDHIQIAEYVAEYLNNELEHLWQQAKGEYSQLKGLGAKNAFFLGVAKGYIAKANQGALAVVSAEKALLILDKQLATAKQLVYKKLRSLKTYSKNNLSADLLGQSCGKGLSIKPAVATSQTSATKLLSAVV
jgi:hypothetical protein